MTISTGETLTHKAWTAWADDAVGELRRLAADLDKMAAAIAADDGDQAQIAAIRAWQAQIEDAASAGEAMLARVNARQIPVGEAVAAAGGPDNTPHKQYADEAR